MAGVVRQTVVNHLKVRITSKCFICNTYLLWHMLKKPPPYLILRLYSLQANADYYSHYVPMNYKSYCKRISKPGVWGDHVTLQVNLCSHIHAQASNYIGPSHSLGLMYGDCLRIIQCFLFLRPPRIYMELRYISLHLIRTLYFLRSNLKMAIFKQRRYYGCPF